ncbi:hypothetical protein KCU99_g2159, partial [Aureobasidium melanogenum]
MTTKNIMENRNLSLFNSNTLSDITMKFNGRQVSAHKAILAQKSGYFMTAFISLLPVATSKEVDLGDDDDPEAIQAMLRYIYDMPYAHQVTDHSSFEEDLVFCLNVFIVADKYDVTGLRRKVVPDFRLHLERTWRSETFVACMKKLYGPESIHMADPSLQTAVADFFVDNMSKIVHHQSLVTMIEQDNSFTGRILAGLLKPTSGSIRYLSVCHKPHRGMRAGPDCTSRLVGDSGYLAAAMNGHCVHCGTAAGAAYNKTGGGTADSQFRHTVKVVLM